MLECARLLSESLLSAKESLRILPRPLEAVVKRVPLAVLFLVLTLLVVVAFAGERTASTAEPETYWPTHGWRSSTPEAQGMDSEVLAQAFEYIRQHHIPIHSLLIVRNGYV